MPALADLAHASFAMGGGVAFVFIVALVLGIASLMAVYVGSAVVVLDRSARVARRPALQVAAGAGVAALAAWLILDATRPELASASSAEWAGAWARMLAAVAVATAVGMGAVAWLLRRVAPGRVAAGTAAGVALGLALAAAGTGTPLVPGGLALAPLLAWGTSALRRRRRGGVGPTRAERGLAAAAALFVAAVGLVWLPAAVTGALAAAGQAILAFFAAAVLLGLLPHAVAGFADMRGTAEWFIAARYLVAKRRQVFISAITAICVLGIAAGVWLIIVVLSVMNGFERTWRDEILGDRAHFVILREEGPITGWPEVLERVRAAPDVVAAAPYIEADAMVRGRGGEIYSVRLRGIDPEAVGRINRLRDDVVAGSLDALVRPGSAEEPGAETGDDERAAAAAGRAAEAVAEAPEEDLPGLVVGNQLAASLGVGVGDRLLVIAPMGGPPTPLGPAPRLTRFEVVGLFRASFYQYDEVYAYVSIPAAQDFRRAGPVIDGIEAVTTDIYRSRSVGEAVAARLGEGFRARDWKQYFPAFFQALKTERVMMGVLLAMIMVVAAFIIVATLVMMIMEKSADIAILKAMGARDALVERIFALEGTMIGLLGTLLGVLAGLAVTHRLGWIQDRIQAIVGIDALPAGVDQLSGLPSRVDPVQVAVVVLLALVLSLGATLAPSVQGARIDPAEGLRHE